MKENEGESKINKLANAFSTSWKYLFSLGTII